MKELTKLYSKRAVLLSTFLGGTIAAGILMRRNSINLGRRKEGNLILIAGILIMAVFVAFGTLGIDDSLHKITQTIATGLALALAGYCTTEFHGKELEEHAQQGLPFYSMWRAAGVGTTIVAIIVAIAIYSVHIEEQYTYYEPFEKFETEFFQNQEGFELMHDMSLNNQDRLGIIEQTVLPKQNRNIHVCQNMLSLEGLP